MELLVLGGIVALLVLGPRRTPRQRTLAARAALIVVALWVLFLAVSTSAAVGPVWDRFMAGN